MICDRNPESFYCIFREMIWIGILPVFCSVKSKLFTFRFAMILKKFPIPFSFHKMIQNGILACFCIVEQAKFQPNGRLFCLVSYFCEIILFNKNGNPTFDRSEGWSTEKKIGMNCQEQFLVQIKSEKPWNQGFQCQHRNSWSHVPGI